MATFLLNGLKPQQREGERPMAEKSERDTIEQLAKRLAEQSGYGSMTYQLPEGFAVPRWITFLSRAEQLWKERGV